MEFSNKAKDLLKKAGWKEGRKIAISDLKLPYSDYPDKVITFLQEFGNLEGDCDKVILPNSKSVNQFYISPSFPEQYLIGDNDYPYYQAIIGKKLFPIGAYDGNGYYICCDADGRVYMIGEYCYYWGNSLYEGIERILLNNWRNSLQLDEKTSKWWNVKGEYVDLPPL